MPLYVPATPFDGDQDGPLDLGFKVWSGDSAQMVSGTAITAGVLTMTRLTLSRPASISTLNWYVNTAGATLTNVGVALYTAAGALLTSSVNVNGATAAAFQSSGTKPCTVTAQTFGVGTFYAALWITGTTMPSMLRGTAGGGTPNVGTVLAGGTGLRFAAANAALTTTAPATATQTGNAPGSFWCAAS